MDLTEAEDIKRGSKNSQKNYTKKDLHDPDNHNGMVTHLEPDILECEVKWAFGSITMNKASGGDTCVKSWLTGKDSDAGKDWGQEEKGATEDEMVEWHYWLNGHEFEQTWEIVENRGVCML